MRKVLPVTLAVLFLVAPRVPSAQSPDEAAQKNALEAQQALDLMVTALGGQAWLEMKN